LQLNLTFLKRSLGLILLAIRIISTFSGSPGSIFGQLWLPDFGRVRKGDLGERPHGPHHLRALYRRRMLRCQVSSVKSSNVQVMSKRLRC